MREIKRKINPPGSSPASNNLGEGLTGLKRPKIAVFLQNVAIGDNKKAPYCHRFFLGKCLRERGR